MVVPWDNSLRAGVERCDVVYLAAENDVCVVICVLYPHQEAENIPRRYIQLK